MKIKNIDGLTANDLQKEVDGGGRFLYFLYTVSLIIVTFKGTSGVYLVRCGEKPRDRSFRFTLASFLLGWWGIPWGPKYTIKSIRINLKGGKDVTDEVMGVVTGYALFEQVKNEQKKVTV